MPKHLRLVKGNPSRRPINEDEPKPEAKAPSCPNHLNADAKREWKRVTKELLKLGLLTEIDRAAIARYCQAWGEWCEATRKIDKLGMLVRTPNGYPVPSPYVVIANQAHKRMLDIEAQFGMTPSSRTRVSVAKGGKTSEWDAFFEE